MSQVFPYHDKDLSALPPPSVLEPLDYEQLLAERKAQYNALMPLLLDSNGQPTIQPATLVQTDTETFWKVPLNDNAGLYYLDLESDPSARHLQADGYVEMLYRNRINQAALAVMPAYASGDDLDHIALLYGIHRLTVTPATENNPAVLESDEAFRKRVLLGIEGFARGGSTGWYLFNVLSASGEIKDAHVYSPTSCDVSITILSHHGDGTASQALLDTVSEHINSRHTRVLGDRVTIQSAEVIHYTLDATLYLDNGPSSSAVINAVQTAYQAYRNKNERIGRWVTQSGVYHALHQPGVYRAVINTPALPLEITRSQAAYCDAVNLSEVRDGL